MKKRSTTVTAVGVVVALLGMLLVFIYTGRIKARAGAGLGPSASAFVATSDIPVGTSWEAMADMIAKQEIPGGLRPSTAVSKSGQVAGKTSIQAISKGEVLTTTQFSAATSGSIDIPKGHNAVTINLAPPQGVGRYIQPGARANVFASFKTIPGSTNPAEGAVTKLLLTNVRVLANQPAGEGDEKSATATPSGTGEILLTLALTPDQAEKLIFAKENGSLWLGLMRPGDAPAAPSTGRTFRTALI
ncbi:MAG TPA: Flp pilus assembly protein CpaB [Actinomycetota bacterium]|nr:Flp pilus assembly protein CpaB [Actinomycetota bacterium]